jgi:hypothetical protein
MGSIRAAYRHLTARCMSNEYATYLEVSVHPVPSGKRTDDIPGDLTANGHVLQDWVDQPEVSRASIAIIGVGHPSSVGRAADS